MRWILAVGECSFTIRHYKGASNETAETLKHITDKIEETHFSHDKDFKCLQVNWKLK